MIDERVEAHLQAQAQSLHLPVGDVGSIVGRANRRRRNRRAALSGAMAIAVAASGVAAFAGSDDRTLVASQPGAVVESPFDWTVVEPNAGLAWSQSVVTAADGGVYGLSTAPGADDDPPEEPRSLYRSDGGNEWEEVPLPDDLWAGGLSATAEALYAVGTAPGPHGGTDVRVARTSDDGATWQVDPVSLGLEELQERYPGVLVTRMAKLAEGPAGLVGMVEVQASLDVDALLPEGVSAEHFYQFTTEGVDVWATAPPEEQPVASHRFTWDDLDVDPELVPFVGGRLYTFVIGGGAAEAVELPSGSYGGELVTDDAGYYLTFTEPVVVGRPGKAEPRLRVLHSVNGRSWAPDDFPDVRGGVAGTGRLDGRAAIAVLDQAFGGDQTSAIYTAEPGGGWSALNLLDAAGLVTPDQTTSYVHNVAFGPLGVAAVVEHSNDEGSEHRWSVVHSTDGRTVSAVAVDEHLDDPVGDVQGLVVGADAVSLRWIEPDARDDQGRPRQRLLVGTPRG